MSYLFNCFDVAKTVAIRKGPSAAKLMRSFRKGVSVKFKLADGRVLVGQIRAIEHPDYSSCMFHYSGDFEDEVNKYRGVELSYDPRRGGYMLIMHEVSKDAPVRVHISKSC